MNEPTNLVLDGRKVRIRDDEWNELATIRLGDGWPEELGPEPEWFHAEMGRLRDEARDAERRDEVEAEWAAGYYAGLGDPGRW